MIAELEAVETKPEMVTDPTDPNYSYHHDYSRVSASMLKTFSRSRRDYEAYYITRELEHAEPSPRMNLGSVVHAVFLEGHSVEELTVPYPEYALNKNGGLIGQHAQNFRTILSGLETGDYSRLVAEYPSKFFTPSGALSTAKAIVAERSDFEEANRDKIILSPSQSDEVQKCLEGKTKVARYPMKQCDVEACQSIVDSLRKHEFAKWFGVERSIAEEPIFWTHEASGLQCRCMPDLLIPDCTSKEGNRFTFFADLKVTVNWKPDDFINYLSGNRRGSMKGWIQASHYANGIGEVFQSNTGMRFICANPERPHQVVSNAISGLCFDTFRSRYETMMMDLAKCYETGDWSDTWEGTDNEAVLQDWEIV